MIKCPKCQAEIPLSHFTAELGRRSKGKTSEAKKRASRLNGLKGGRPPARKGKQQLG